MSQEYTTPATKRPRRTRSQRNRPVLVSGTALEEQVDTPTTDALQAEELAAVESTRPEAEQSSRTWRAPRLPGFFSKVEKSTEEEAKPEADVVQARLARATRGKTAPTSATTTPKEDAKKEIKTTSSAKNASTPPARPRLFEPRHFIGMAIYLLVAEFVLPVEANFAQSAHLDDAKHPLLVIPGLNAPIYPSFIFNIATLIILLYILVKLNLLPNTLSASRAAQQRAQQQGQRKPNNGGGEVIKQAPPSIRPGVKGDDDDLYQAYRVNQRRDKKR